MHIFQMGARAGWRVLTSARAVDEIVCTPDRDLRAMLEEFAVQLVDSEPDDIDRAKSIAESSLLSVLPDPPDRRLVADAIVLGCDAFCTCDRRTIVNRRHRLPHLPVHILLPQEWWSKVKPWGGLWL